MRKKVDEAVDVQTETDPKKLARLLINELNKAGDEKIAWNLQTDVDDPTTVREFISTGSTLLDYVVSNRRDGGVPVGKFTEISGEEASGKSLISAHIMANTQRKGGLAVYIDTENAAHPDFMRQIGVDTDRLVYLQPGTIEECFEAIEKVISMARARDVKKPITIVWDSLAATPPQAEIEGDYDPNSRIGIGAKAMAKGLRKLTQTVGRDRVTIVFTNQLKFKPGVMYGDPMTTPYGKAVPYHASVRIRLTQGQKLKDGDDGEKGDVTAIHTRAKCMKSRLGPPLRVCEFDIRFDHGIDDVGSWFGYLHGAGEVEKRAGYCYMRIDGNEVRFRESEFVGKVASDPGFRTAVLGALERRLVVKYDKRPTDQQVDGDSLMDVEAVVDVVSEAVR